MTTVLVVDDSNVDRTLASRLLQDEGGFDVVMATDGDEALEVMARERPDLVLTDLQMPNMDGLSLVEALICDHPSVPVVLMTAHGSEEIAVAALQRGASSYVAKRHLSQDLISSVRQVLALAREARSREQLLDLITLAETHFVLDNNPTVIPLLTSHLQNSMEAMKLCDENGLLRAGMALTAALDNALYHGNLEVDRHESAGDVTRYELAVQRRKEPLYAERRIHVRAILTRVDATFNIRDEGSGFDTSSLPDPKNPSAFDKSKGRGCLLMRTFMEEVLYNDAGNEVTMVFRAHSGASSFGS